LSKTYFKKTHSDISGGLRLDSISDMIGTMPSPSCEPLALISAFLQKLVVVLEILLVCLFIIDRLDASPPA